VTVGPIEAAILGIVEGITEFIPVSSTGHLILTEHLIGAAGPTTDLLDVVIQVGAILAICWLYRERLWVVARGLPNDPQARHFARNIGLAFLPSLVVGAFAHNFIKRVLFSPWVVGVSLILGGIAILVIERFAAKREHVRRIEAMSAALAFGIGLCQLLSLVPGVSRSGATIMGALALGAERKTAAEFSFFLAIPTMFAAAGYDLLKNRALLDVHAAGAIAVGLIVSFIVALLVVRWFVGFVSRHGFEFFGWYRIAAGAVAIVILSTVGAAYAST
jgi:undecaprenyl-diphosphatase